ncbi:MAG: nitrous oxide reductase family maturation protein NosD [Ignavibacteria bacterium]|nr:nitrous oxide reductase family maturation protein NosD [Ignavibacteria bacterium]
MNKVIFIIALIALINSVNLSKEITVNPGESIKNAVSLADNGDRIIIKEGTYNESGILIDKNIELIGENYPVIDGLFNGDIIIIQSDSVTVKGFSIHNSGNRGLKDYAALRIENSACCNIISNKLNNNYFGIFLSNSSYCNVLQNEASSNAVTESSSGNGIHLWKCTNINVKNNTISGHRDGIYIEFSVNCQAESNSSFKNIRYGLHFMFSNNNVYENNVFSNNGAGVAVMYTKNVRMINNRFENNKGPNSYGLLLKEITDSYIERNTFSYNTVGIYCEGGTRLLIANNNLTGNGYALKILGNCTDDTIKANNFFANTFDVTTNSTFNNNLFTQNYWDKYNGYDLNKDGKGDVPFRPVSLFSKIVEETPESVFLLRSFVAELLDMAERVVPVFTPESLMDNEPEMKAINNELYTQYN